MGRRRSSGPIRLGPLLLLALCACDVSEQAGRDIEDGTRLTREQLDAQRAAQRGEVLRVDRPYYGGALKVTRGSRQGDPLPRQLEAARGVSLRLPGQADIRTIAAAITSASGLPVNIRTRYILTGGDVVEVPIGTRMRAAYTGPLSGFLDRLSTRMDVAWSYDGKGIAIDRMVTRDYRVSLPVGRTTVTDTAEADRGPVIATERGLAHWDELEARLQPLAPPPARITLAPGSGRVSVFGPPSVQAAARKVIEDTQATASARIGLEVGVYFVDSEAAEDFGLTTSGFRIGHNIARSGSSIVIGSEATGRGGLRLTGPNGSSIDLAALARDRSVVDYRLASSIAQSGVITPLGLTRERSYIRNRTIERDGRGTGGTSSQGDDPGRVSYEIGELETGLGITALPRLIDSRQIHLSLSVIQRAFLGFDQDVETRTGGIQAPSVETREIRNTSVLAPGETLVLSGYEQDVSSTGASGIGLFKAIGLGGKREARTRKVRMVILVRPSLIPQARGRS
ncbi:secretion protein [Ruegeria sp.]|uniref:secretion protein n=1 Tax=Ruegeria sp. TaxID=1879320 RepID=UPI003AFFCD85